jgi:glycerophosphoryl diester phosphodiesterase
MTELFLWAHRGASARAPENTLAAFRAALEDGADGLEYDVHLSRDGVPVIIHDDTVERTTDGQGRVADLSWKEISALDAGSWFDKEFAGESIPALVELFQWNADRLKLNAEIKDSSAADAVVEIWKRFPDTPLVVSSFDHDLLRHLNRREPMIPLGFLFDGGDWLSAVETATNCKAWSFHPRQEVVDHSMIEACRRRGLAVFPWTVDGPRRLESLWKMGVDGIFCNDPGRARSLAKFFQAGLDAGSNH